MNSYPDDDDGQALKRIESHGSNMSLAMDVDFFIAVPSQDAGEGIAAAIKNLGYTPSVEADGESGEWTCYASKNMVATYEAIVEAQVQLGQVCEPLNGYLDGWGSFGNAPAN